MASPGLSELITTTLRSRTHKLADNVTRNNALLRELSKRSTGLMPFDGGRTILQELDYANNTNATWYSGYETVAINPQETFTSAEFDIKQLMVAVSVSGLETLQNAGKWIGILERLMIFGFILLGKWEGIGFLLAAKSVFRFGDLKDARDMKLTEYVLIGTLLSFGMAMLLGALTVYFTGISLNPLLK